MGAPGPLPLATSHSEGVERAPLGGRAHDTHDIGELVGGQPHVFEHLRDGRTGGSARRRSAISERRSRQSRARHSASLLSFFSLPGWARASSGSTETAEVPEAEGADGSSAGSGLVPAGGGGATLAAGKRGAGRCGKRRWGQRTEGSMKG